MSAARADAWGSALARGWSGGEINALTRAVERRREAGLPIFDLTESNPTRAGIEFPAETLAAILAAAAPKAATYEPDPLGDPAAREAVAAWYARRGAAADPARILLTPGTSMAYFYAFRLLLDAGESALAPMPGYPLFDELAAIAGAGLTRYHLARGDAGWTCDADAIERACTGNERALIVVAPHNPTGAALAAADWSALGALCRRRNLALIVDEVFCETRPAEASEFARPSPEDFPLMLTFNGVSKMLALPQWKLGWIKVDGDAARVGPLLRAMEFMSDAFLPLPAITQAMLPGLLEAGDAGALRAVQNEIQRRRALALSLLEWKVEPCEAGPYLCLRLPEGADDEAAALAALDEEGVLVHPGHYYDLPAHLVVACIAEESTLRAGIAGLNRLRSSMAKGKSL